MLVLSSQYCSENRPAKQNCPGFVLLEIKMSVNPLKQLWITAAGCTRTACLQFFLLRKILRYLLKTVRLQICKPILWVEAPPACTSVMRAVVTISVAQIWTVLMLSVCILGTGHLPQLHYEEAVPAAHKRHGAVGGHRFHCCFVSMWIWGFRFCSEGSLLADVWSTAPWLKHQIQDSNNVH